MTYEVESGNYLVIVKHHQGKENEEAEALSHVAEEGGKNVNLL